ncbi:hypothetical protein B0T11DRAFT_288943 [Plectosphaerella cucumerina]|uniref:DUF6546 domain-containing protein n=1 Tax=Plectosphaerella cucumerina TaxID=40658 RepID=A0A8K0TB75_9PEZI|nr:hypothetical protein B0T11DRAFT_288943 [Plectosphaerella cucumerina]
MPNGWSILPPELRQIIYDQINIDLTEDQRQSNDATPFTSLPLVSREFQREFGYVNFRYLVLDQHRLKDFERIVSKHRIRWAFVRRIDLRVQLPHDNETKDAVAASENEDVFLNTVHEFMSIVSTWRKIPMHSSKREGHRPCLVEGVKLHLGSSTGQHLSTANSPAPITHTEQQDTQQPEADTIARKFARATVIESLAILRRHPPCITPSFLDQLIDQGMPCLEKLSNEAWDINRISTNRQDRDECFAVLDVVRRRKIHSLDLFQPSGHTFCSNGIPELELRSQSFMYAMLATGLRYCCMSNLFDGLDFVSHIINVYYPHLECLVLRSQHLTMTVPPPNPHYLSVLFKLALCSAAYMPKLQVMDLWNGDSQNRLLVRIVPMIRTGPNRRIAIAVYAASIPQDELRVLLDQFRQSCLTSRWEPVIWREGRMEPAEDSDHSPPHPASYPDAHRYIKRVAETMIS